MQDDAKFKYENAYYLGDGSGIIHIILILECFDIIYTPFFIARVFYGSTQLILTLGAMSGVRSDLVSVRISQIYEYDGKRQEMELTVRNIDCG